MHKLTHAEYFFQAAAKVCKEISKVKIEQLAKELAHLEGRLFILGVGGSAANAGHAVNDFRKLCGIEAYAPTDNVSELTARTNDEGWGTVFVEWLKVSKFNNKDAILVLSVGGGTNNSSLNIVRAINLAKSVEAKVFSIVGRGDGFAADHSNLCIIVPIIEEKWITPLSEAFQAVIWHALVSHPLLQRNRTKW